MRRTNGTYDSVDHAFSVRFPEILAGEKERVMWPCRPDGFSLPVVVTDPVRIPNEIIIIIKRASFSIGL